MGVDDTVALTGDGGVNNVTDTQGPPPLAVGFTQGGQGIGGLTTLTDENGQAVRRDDRITVAELAGDIDFHRYPGNLFEIEFPHQSGMPGGTAGNDEDFLQRRQLLFIEAEILKVNIPLFDQSTPGNGVGEGARLLVNFLKHEMPVAPFFRHGRAPGDGFTLLDQRLPGKIGKTHPHRGKNDHLAIFEKYHLAGVGKHGRNIGGNKIFPLPLTNHQGRAELGGDQLVRFVNAEYRHRISALDLGQGLTHCLLKISTVAIMFLHQMGDDFRIGFRTELMPKFLQAPLETNVIFDDTVVYQDDIAGTMGMRVDLRRAPVGRPAGMTNAAGAAGRMIVEKILQIEQLALGPANMGNAVLEGTDAG